MRILLVIVYLFIAYGSLFPFNFSFLEFSIQVVNFLKLELPSLGDILGNLLLFLPLGLLHSFPVEAASTAKKNNNKTWVCVFVFALILQLMQIGLPSRDQNFVDVVFNMSGFGIGMLLGARLHITNRRYKAQISHLPLAIGGMFLLSQLSPFIPSIDVQNIKSSVKPLLSMIDSPMFLSILIHTVWWLLAIRLLAFGRVKINVLRFIMYLSAFLLAKVLIYSNVVTWIDIISPFLAFTAWHFIRFDSERKIKSLISVAIFTLLVSSVDELSGFSFNASLLLPFYSYLEGAIYQGAGTILFKLFVFSSILWLAIEANIKLSAATQGLFFVSLLIESIQLFMPLRTFDLSDPILVFVAYLVIRHLGDYLASQLDEEYKSEVVVTNQTSDDNAKKVAGLDLKSDAIKYLSSYKTAGLKFIVGFLVFYFSLSLFLSIPSIPYNVKELFADSSSLIAILCFYFFLMSLGGSSFWIATRIQQTKGSIWNVISFSIWVSLFAFVMLAVAVEEESLQDILGAPIYPREIYAYQIGEGFTSVMLNVFSVSLIANVVTYIEYFVRFFAFHNLIQLPLLACILLSVRKSHLHRVKALIVVGILFLLSFYVTFYQAATDNVTELIAEPWVVTLILVLLSISVFSQVKLADLHSVTLRFIAIAIGLLTCLITRFLTPFGFESIIHKYGHTFSALDFILGQDRTVILSNNDLFIRWCVLIGVTQVLLFGGLKTVKSIAPIVDILARRLLDVNFHIGLTRSKWQMSIVLCLGIYVTYRLFGPSYHWQTVQLYFANQSAPEYVRESSTVTVPKNAKPGLVKLNGQPVESLTHAFNRLKDFDEVWIGKGHYNLGVSLSASNVRIIAEKGAVLYGVAIQNKGALLVTGDNNYIEGLECHSISAPDNNGVCVRLEGRGITLSDVYFHHAQGGLLGSPKGGDIRVVNSVFEHLGHNAFYHGIYTLKKTRLFIEDSKFLNTRNGGHEIKSRSMHTEIRRTIVASNLSRDSRLIDVPNGGTLIIEESTLIEGVYSENHDLLSWGVEGVLHPNNHVTIQNNLIISDKPRANLVSYKEKPQNQHIFDNLVIGKIDGIDESVNIVISSRKEANLPSAPELPNVKY